MYRPPPALVSLKDFLAGMIHRAEEANSVAEQDVYIQAQDMLDQVGRLMEQADTIAERPGEKGQGITMAQMYRDQRCILEILRTSPGPVTFRMISLRGGENLHPALDRLCAERKVLRIMNRPPGGQATTYSLAVKP